MKMKLCFIFFLLLICSYGFSNDTYYSFYGGNIVPMDENDITVRMEEEIITIVLNPGYYEITVDFTFYNYGEDIGLYVGFPFYGGTEGYSAVSDFKCWTNDIETNYIIVPFNNRSVKDDIKSTYLELAHVRKIDFPKNQITKTKISYKVKYYEEVKYLYGTGSSWKGTIEKITLIIENNLSETYLRDFELPNKKYTFEKLADNKWKAYFYDIEPKYLDCITFKPKYIFFTYKERYYPDEKFLFSEKKITRNDLFWYTKGQLRILRNTIYALHGYEFKNEELKELFNEQKWYKVDSNFTEDSFSKIEKANIKTLLEEEKSR